MGTASAAASTVASSVGEDAVEVSDEEDASMMLAAILLKTRLPRDPRSSLRIPAATNRSLLLLLLNL